MMGLAAALALAGFGSMAFARQGNPRPRKISGVVVGISPRQMTIQGSAGKPLLLITDRDYTDEVAFGSEVKATYVFRNGVDALETLEPPLENLFVPAYEIRDHIHKVIILPSSDVSGSGSFFDALNRYLQSNFNWYIKPRVMAEEIRDHARRANPSTLDAIDPKTGQFDMAAYLAGHKDLIRRIAKETRVDAVLEANLEEVEADFDAKRRVASWDGIKESTNAGGGSALDNLIFVPIKGEIPATTLVLTLWDAQAKPLWSGRRGFSVLYVQEGFLGKLRMFPLSERLADQAAVTRWFNSVFGFLRPKTK